MTEPLNKLKALKLYGMASAWGELMAETRRQALTGEAMAPAGGGAGRPASAQPELPDESRAFPAPPGSDRL